MKPGDRVLVAIAGRADGKVNGWVWCDFPATVTIVRRGTAIIERDGWDQQEIVPLNRIKPLATFDAPMR